MEYKHIMEEIRIDMRKQTPEERAQGVRDAQLCFKLNHTMPYTDEYNNLVSQLFGEFGEGSRLMTPTTVVRGKGREARRTGYLLSRHQDQEERSAYVGRLLHYQAHRQRVHARPCHWRVYSRRADQGRQRDRAAQELHRLRRG